MSENIFEIATRHKLRFPNPCGAGNISTEDLWDLSRADLDKLYRNLTAMNRNASETGLIRTKPSPEQRMMDVALEVVTRVFEVKEEMRIAREVAAERREKREKIKALLAEKQDEGLKALDIAELQKQLTELEE